MAINRYVLTSTVAIAAGTPATVVAGEPGTGGPAGYGNAGTVTAGGESNWPAGQSLLKGMIIMLDPTGPLFTQIGAGNLQLVTPAQETGGTGLGTSN